MDTINRIICQPVYQQHLRQNAESESERIFCNHHFEHLLAVARLTYIFMLETGNPYITREMAYAAGLLHDIGRWQEYRTGLDHAEASANLAGPILDAAGFSADQAFLVSKAIRQHRLSEDAPVHRSPLSRALRKADRYSRLCYQCAVRPECKQYRSQPHSGGLQY